MRNHARPRSTAFVAVAILAALTDLAGCAGSDGLPREAVSGSVSIEGKPLGKGLITFLPADSNVPTQGGGPIVDGKYSIPRGQGLVPGKYKVVISAPEDKAEQVVDTTNDMPGMPPIAVKDAVPPQYNTDSLLTAEVTAGGRNLFEFNLTGAPAGK